MFSFLKRKDKSSEAEVQKDTADDISAEKPAEEQLEKAPEIKASSEEAPSQPAKTVSTESQKTTRPGLFSRLKNSLSKTRKGFTENLATLVMGRKEIDDDLLDELEMILLTADVGVEATDTIIQNLTGQVSRKELKEPEKLIQALKQQLETLLEPVTQPLVLPEKEGPFVILMVGVNGVGKTTTIGKLAKKFQNEGKSVMLAAGDTFRAAAVEQLQTWGERNQVPVVAQKTGADSAAVIFDAIQSATAKNIDVLIADTAGRLHTQSNLMEELKKVKRVIQKVDSSAPHEVMLVLDAGTGQNALSQAQQFYEAVEITGLTLTKLDGTAKGGIIFALAEKLGIPVRFIGVGEAIDDLRPFDANEFSEALFDQSNIG
ncbi:MAG: signal recognition particle-docking protein FtsY [Hydrogenovibrio crunogenus]|uniref:Signal recognition particle receptor FtsY n=1 Tax=Hydrogenovibrio crunogenus (strain DSM 25203 / XCL-2) TaxID=317025 RepID=Q31E91_HYDCU|nr:signal recognition particle-docking protein FtsY [Hydrogenovibrio crunogenus]